MSSQDKISLTFNDEEEFTSVFLIEDLIKEYNSKVIKSPPYLKLYPLSLQPINVNSSHPSQINSNLPTIRPMTKEEIDSMHMQELHAADWMQLKTILSDQVTPAGVLSNISNITTGVTIVEMVNELGLKGKVIYKTTGNKTYVILKGLAKDRNILTGTRYLNTHPEIVRLGLAKVSVTDLYKQGFKSSLVVYGAVKAVEVLKLILEEDGLDPTFFAKFGTDVPKLAIGTLAATAVGSAVVAAGLPIAVGAGVVLVMGIVTGIGLEMLDHKLGLTEKLSEAVDTMWTNLKKFWNTPSNDQAKLSMNSNLLEGLVFGRSLFQHQQILQRGDVYVYTA